MKKSLIEMCKLLKEKATHGEWGPGDLEKNCIAEDGGRGNVVLRRTNGGSMPSQENIDLICGLRNTVPKLLDVLDFRPGDVKRLAGLLRLQVINDVCTQEEIDMLDRLHTMCCKMEAKSNEYTK